MNAPLKAIPATTIGKLLKDAEWWDHSQAANIPEAQKEEWIKELIQNAHQDPDQNTWYITSGDCLILVTRTDSGSFDVMDLKPRRTTFIEVTDVCTCDTVTLFQFGCLCGS